MRIIDKNTDFYDYLQGTDTEGELVFDRTDSFLLTKEELANHLGWEEKYSYKNRQWSPKIPSYNFLLLQAGNKFWLFLVTIPDIDKNYNMSLIKSWSNYDKERALIKLDVIDFSYGIRWEISNKASLSYNSNLDLSRLEKKADVLVKAVDTKDYKIMSSIDRFSYYVGKDRVEKHIPILKACGIANLVDPMDFYLALDEYFSLEKQASERTDAEGTTNNDKIVNHGFDTKTSFRGR